jgi:DNA-binding TFAR19-related protein (PDSD5 family)
LRKFLTESGNRVLRAAESQYPRMTREIKKNLAKLIREGKLRGPISGEALLWLFNNLGLKVKLRTRIYVARKGEVRELSEALRGE